MNPPHTIAPDMTVQHLLTRWPWTARVFLDRRMACVGCPMAAFETIEEVARVYRQPPRSLLESLQRSAAEGAQAQHSGEGADDLDHSDED